MYIEHNILKYYLRNVYFITGTAYAGKSTTVRMLADRYDMVFCGENYFSAVTDKAANTKAFWSRIIRRGGCTIIL